MEIVCGQANAEMDKETQEWFKCMHTICKFDQKNKCAAIQITEFHSACMGNIKFISGCGWVGLQMFYFVVFVVAVFHGVFFVGWWRRGGLWGGGGGGGGQGEMGRIPP